MKHIKLFEQFINEAKITKGSDIVKIMSNPLEWGPDMKDHVFTKGKNFIFADTFFYNEKEALNRLVHSWSPGGHYYDYFKDEYGVEIEIVATFSDFKAKGRFKKLTSDGVVYLELAIKDINESKETQISEYLSDREEETVSKNNPDLITDKKIITLWDSVYNEDFKSNYPSVWKILKQRPPITKNELKRIWSDTYDTDLEKDKPEFWETLK